jgi:hypothetical protein
VEYSPSTGEAAYHRDIVLVHKLGIDLCCGILILPYDYGRRVAPEAENGSAAVL